MDSFVRPGCTHITVSALLTAAERQRLADEGSDGLARRLLQSSGWLAHSGAEGDPWAANMLVGKPCSTQRWSWWWYAAMALKAPPQQRLGAWE